MFIVFFEGRASDGDATVIDQWWAYSFENGGTFRTFLEGAEQFGGTWNSSGLELNLTSNAMEDFESFEYVGTISSDGQSITIGELELFRSDVVCTSENQPAQ